MDSTRVEPGAGAGSEGPRRSVVRRALSIGGWAALGLVAFVATIVTAVHVDAVSTWIVRQVAARANPYPGTRLSVSRSELSWPAHLRVRGVSLTSEDEGRGPEADIGLLDVRLRLPSLLRGRLEVLEAGIFDVRLVVTQGADSTWDALGPFEPAQGDEGTATFRSGPIRLERARVEAIFAPDELASLPERLVVEELTATVGGLELGVGGTEARVDTLHAIFLPPGSIVDRVVVEGRGRLAADRLEVDGLTLRSGTSDVDVRGILLLPADGSRAAEEVDFTVSAAPLALRDISGFARGVDPEVEVRADLRVVGSAARAEVSGSAAFSDGGTVRLEGTFAPFLGPPMEVGDGAAAPRIQYRAQASVERLRLESLFRGAAPGAVAPGGVVDGTLSVDLEGASRDALTGTVGARVAGLVLGGRRVQPTTVDATVEAGELALEADGGLGGWGRFDVTVEGRPFDEVPEIEARGGFEQEVGREGATPLEELGVTALVARFTAMAAAGSDGRLSPSSLRRLDVDLVSGSYRGRSLAGGRARAAWPGHEGTLTLDQPLGEGRVDARLTLRDTWSGLSALRAEGAVRIANVRLAAVGPDSAVLRPRLDAGTLTGTLEAWLADEQGPAGFLAARMSGRPLDDDPWLTLERLSFSGIDLEAVVGVSTRLDGTGGGRLEGFDPRSARLVAELELAPSRIGDTPVEGVVSLALEDGRLEGEGEATTPGGGLVLSGWARPFGDPLELEIPQARVRGLDLAALLGGTAPATHLNLDARLSASGGTWRTLDGDGVVTVRPSTVRSGEITGGSITLQASAGVAVARGALTSGQGGARASARITLAEGDEELHAELELDLPDLATFLGLEQEVAAVGGVRLDWRGGGEMAVATELRGRVAGMSVDTLVVEASLAGSLLAVDTVRLRADALRADGGGALSLGPPEGSAPVAAEGGAPGVALTFEVTQPLSLGDLPVLGPSSVGSGTGRAEVGGVAGARTAALAVDLGPWETGHTAGRSGTVRAAYGPREMALDVSLPSARTRDTLTVALRAEHGPDAREGLLRRLEISSLAGGAWALAAPAAYTWGDEIGVRGLELRSAEGWVRVDGTVSRVAEHDLSLQLEGAQLAAVGPLLGLQDLRLVADGDMRLRGTVDDPRAEGALRLEIGPHGAVPARLEGEVSLAGGRMSVDARMRDPGGGLLTLVGALPVRLPGAQEEPAAADAVAAAPSGALQLEVETDAFDIAWARAVVPGGVLLGLEGTLSAALSVGGSTAEPRLEGALGVRGGLIQLTTTSTRYQDVRLSASFTDGALHVDSLHARSGAGTAELDGTVGLNGLAPTTLDLSARLDRFLAWNTAPVTAVVSGEITLRGTVDEPWLEGRVSPEGSEINLDDFTTDESAAAVQLTEADYRMLEDYFGYSVDREGEASAVERLAPFGLRLSVSFDQDVFVTRFPQPRVSLESSGDLELDKEPGGPLRVVGTVSVLPERSYIRQFGRRFAIDEGTLTLDGDPMDYQVAARARWELPSYSDPNDPEVMVNLEVSATAESTDLTLSSDPPMDESEIVSYLATGQGQGILSAGDQPTSSNIGVATATGAVAGVLEGFAADRIALDVVEIAVDPVRGTTLVAGRYVSPDVYLGFRQPVSFGNEGDRNRTQNQLTEVELDYRWYQWLTVNLQTSASELRFYLRTRHEY